MREAFKKIREVEDAATIDGDHRASAALSTIGGRVANAANTERKFGLALADLLQRFRAPRRGGRQRTPQVQSAARRQEALGRHRLSLPCRCHPLRPPAPRPGGEGWRDVWTVINHLHDVMARILLHTLGYDGGYQPAVVTGPSIPREVDWVKPDTPARALGYGASIV